MTKYFCDCCGSEIKDANRCLGGQLENTPTTGIGFRIITSLDGTWNAGVFCKYCVIAAVNELDDRPALGAPRTTACRKCGERIRGTHYQGETLCGLCRDDQANPRPIKKKIKIKTD